MNRTRDFQRTQDAHWEQADADHFRWTTSNPGMASLEDALLLPVTANLVRLARRSAPFGIDRYPAKARFASHAVPVARIAAADAIALPFVDGAFASVFVRDLLHHLPDPAAALAEAVRVLRPGGHLLVLEPNGANPLVALQARLVRAEAVLRDFGPTSVLRGLHGLPVTAPEVTMAQALPVRRLLLHHRFGLPRLGRARTVVRGLTAIEHLAERVLPTSRWTYAIVRATRRA
jgi:SAM-dependent methyltransferase